jgi:gliding motility-associated-like protein
MDLRQPIVKELLVSSRGMKQALQGKLFAFGSYWKIPVCILLCVLVFSSASSQDLRLFSLASPASGCMLSNQENVSIVVINVGPTISGGSFDATYTLNNGAPVTETILLPPNFNNGSLISYTFNATADLSVPGTFSFDAYINLASDVNRSNDTLTNIEVISDPTTVGGSLLPSTTVCSGTNSGTITLSGNTGTILGWESSINGTTWTPITNTSTAQAYTNLTGTTYYRAVIKSGACAQAYSSIDTIRVDPLSVGGSVSGSASVCPPASGSLSLSGNTGSIAGWEFSTDGGSNWTTIANTSATQGYSNVTTTSMYRANIKSGVCPAAYSTSATITIKPASVGGITSGSDTVCSGSNGGTITLTGETGNVVRWERSTNGTSWTNVTNSTNSLTYSNLSQTTYFRALVQSCAPSEYSTVSKITVNPVPVAGTLTGVATVCALGNSGTVTLSGSVGTISWQSSSDGVNWLPISGAGSSLSYLNLTASTYFRAKVESSPCTTVYSNAVKITVDPATIPGTISNDTTVCVSGNAGTIQLSQYTGSIVNWETSTNGGVSWNTISNNTSAQNYLNLSVTTMYRAVLKSGVCPVENTSSTTVTVTNGAYAGIISSDDTICRYNNAILITTGHSGNITKWQISTGDSTSWQDVTNTTTQITSTSLTADTYFRVIVSTGTCGVDTSNAYHVVVRNVTADAGNDTTIAKGTQITLHGTGGPSYQWTPASTLSDPAISEPVASPTETTTYDLIVSQQGCSDTASVIITVKNMEPLSINNFISPNDDGINDLWKIDGIDDFETSVVVFNGEGMTVFEASQYDNTWDGKYKGKVVPDGTYYYRVVLKDQSGEQMFKGNLTVLSGK